MKYYRVHTVHGAPLRRCGLDFEAKPRTVTVGDGGDLCESPSKEMIALREPRRDLEWLLRAERTDDNPGGVLYVEELDGKPDEQPKRGPGRKPKSKRAEGDAPAQ